MNVSSRQNTQELYRGSLPYPSLTPLGKFDLCADTWTIAV